MVGRTMCRFNQLNPLNQAGTPIHKLSDIACSQLMAQIYSPILKLHIDSGFLAIAIFTGKDMVYLL